MNDLDRWVEYWKKRFKLSDWTIKVRIGRPSVKNEEGVRESCWGATNWNPGEMTADIVLSKKADNRTLAHEFLHLVIEGEIECPGYNSATERKIERIVHCIFSVGEPKLDEQ